MNTQSATIAVSADALTRVFGKFVAVDQVSFEVRRGEIFGFLGPNGAGKTTTIKMLAGLLAPTSGRGTVAGYDVATEAETIKRNIGYMSQLFSLYADLTVEENIAFFSGLYSVPVEKRGARRDWVLEVAGLADQRARLTGDLPLGINRDLGKRKIVGAAIRFGMTNLNQVADPVPHAVSAGNGDGGGSRLLVQLAAFDQFADQVGHPDLGDRVAVSGHRQKAVRLQ